MSLARIMISVHLNIFLYPSRRNICSLLQPELAEDGDIRTNIGRCESYSSSETNWFLQVH